MAQDSQKQTDASTHPSTNRIAALLALWRREIIADGRLKNPTEYHDWDHILECSGEMTLEEWEWCGANFKVKARVSVDFTAPAWYCAKCEEGVELGEEAWEGMGNAGSRALHHECGSELDVYPELPEPEAHLVCQADVDRAAFKRHVDRRLRVLVPEYGPAGAVAALTSEEGLIERAGLYPEARSPLPE